MPVQMYRKLMPQPFSLHLCAGIVADSAARYARRSAPGAPTYSWRNDGRSRSRSVGAQPSALRPFASYVALCLSAAWFLALGRHRSDVSRKPPYVGCIVSEVKRVPRVA